MISKRAKITTAATLAGLGALAGIAAESNHGLPENLLAANGHGIVTSASGATAAAATGETASTRAPIVTRASGGAAAPLQQED